MYFCKNCTRTHIHTQIEKVSCKTVEHHERPVRETVRRETITESTKEVWALTDSLPLETDIGRRDHSGVWNNKGLEGKYQYFPTVLALNTLHCDIPSPVHICSIWIR